MGTSTVEGTQRVGFANMREASKFLAVSQSYLYRLVQEGRVPSTTIGTQRRVAWVWLYEQERIASSSANGIEVSE